MLWNMGYHVQVGNLRQQEEQFISIDIKDLSDLKEVII